MRFGGILSPRAMRPSQPSQASQMCVTPPTPAAYGVSWTSLIGDVRHEGHKAYTRNQRSLHLERENGSKDITSHGIGESRSLGSGIAGDSIAKQSPEGRVVQIEDYRAVMAQRAVCQGLASMGLPAFTVHNFVLLRTCAQGVDNPEAKNMGSDRPSSGGCACAAVHVRRSCREGDGVGFP